MLEKPQFIGLSVAFALLLSCGSGRNCAPGFEGCACRITGDAGEAAACEGQLTCLSNVCVDPSGNSGTGGSQGNGGNMGGASSGGDSSTGGTSGDNGTSGTGAAPGAGGTSETGGNGGGGNTGGTNGTESCDAEQDYRGSCTAGTAQACIDGQWVDSDCAGCEVLSPSSLCGHVTVFAIGAPPLYGDFSHQITSFTQSGSSVEVSVDFTEANQIGIVQFRLTDTVSINSLSVSSTVTSGVVDVSLEDGSGVNGCTYPLIAGSIDRLSGSCWTEDYNILSPASVVSVRLNASGPGSATMTISGVTMDHQ